MDWITTLGLAMGASWVSGIRLYGCVATLGLLGKFGLAQLPGQLTVLTHDWVIAVAAALFVIEFFADKIAYVDSAWDAIHSFIRIPAGAVLASAAFANYDPAVQACAFLIGGGIALSAHGSKAATRVAANHSPEPVSNVFLSLGEDALAAAGVGLAIWAPLAAMGLVGLAVVASVFFIKFVWKSLKGLWGRKRDQAVA